MQMRVEVSKRGKQLRFIRLQEQVDRATLFLGLSPHSACYSSAEAGMKVRMWDSGASVTPLTPLWQELPSPGGACSPREATVRVSRLLTRQCRQRKPAGVSCRPISMWRSRRGAGVNGRGLPRITIRRAAQWSSLSCSRKNPRGLSVNHHRVIRTSPSPTESAGRCFEYSIASVCLS